MQTMRLYDLARWVVNLGDFSAVIRRALQAGPSDRILEIGCGTGANSRCIDAFYVGIDPDAARIRYAVQTHGSDQRHFLVGTVGGWLKLLRPKSFTQSLIVNVLHHVDDPTADRILSQVAQLTERRLVLMDAAPERSNLLQSTLLSLDPGKHMRSAAELAALMEPHFRIDDTSAARTRSGSLQLNVLTGTPRRP